MATTAFPVFCPRCGAAVECEADVDVVKTYQAYLAVTLKPVTPKHKCPDAPQDREVS